MEGILPDAGEREHGAANQRDQAKDLHKGRVNNNSATNAHVRATATQRPQRAASRLTRQMDQIQRCWRISARSVDEGSSGNSGGAFMCLRTATTAQRRSVSVAGAKTRQQHAYPRA